ncbi:MAG: outer membrane protein assembly factor BamE [Alphaproteobacteria bacterium]|nr:outer membrane protein assembly factor BamE [Alphaproteobacteria bacterium]
MNFFVRHGRILALLSLLSACTPVITARGQQPAPEVLAEIEIGTTSRRDVERTLGTPSTQGVFRENVWYYMSERTERTAFFNPKVIERKIVAIVFDDAGVVEDIVTYNENDKKEIELVSRVTATTGNELTFLQQLFGNVGRFSNE